MQRALSPKVSPDIHIMFNIIMYHVSLELKTPFEMDSQTVPEVFRLSVQFVRRYGEGLLVGTKLLWRYYR